MQLEFAAIKRAKKFSPNHIENDALILMRTADELIKLGAKVKFYDEEMLFGDSIKENFIFSMSREDDVIKKLKQLQKKGKVVINSPKAVKNCFRENVTTKLMVYGIPYPDSVIIKTNDFDPITLSKFNGSKVWVKRDKHIQHSEDRALATCDAERNNIVREFGRRGIKKAIVQEHLVGNEVKFYGVRGTEFFHWYYSHENFSNIKLDEERFITLARRAAETLKVDVYGGDALITPDGSIYIIDFNDWPSFAPCRDEASKAIAKMIYRKAQFKLMTPETTFVSEETKEVVDIEANFN